MSILVIKKLNANNIVKEGTNPSFNSINHKKIKERKLYIAN